MRKPLLAIPCILALAACAFLSAQPQRDTRAVRLRLVNTATGKNMAGMVRIFQQNKPLDLPPLFSRWRGLQHPPGTEGWHVVPAGGAALTPPRAALVLEAVAGLETTLTRLDLPLDKAPPEEIAVKLDAAFRPEDHGLVAGNTHLHLMKLSKKEAEEYLKQIPAADQLRVLFLSYLERHKADAEYITNIYPPGDLSQFNATGVLFNNGEEHRHNFGAGGEGYGHVMFLGIKSLVKPVSLGPGITGSGFDDRPLRPGIDEAKKQGGTVIWCHNGFGTEDILNALTGRLDALNVFDGSRRGSFEDNYYRYLNIGLRLPISTGTDWFIYDFSRVYAKVPGKLTIAGWLDALKAGRCQATNGPLLSLEIDGKEIGDTLSLAGPKTLRIKAGAVGRHDFGTLELVHNGKVIHKASAKDKLFRASMTYEVRVEGPGWFAVRIAATSKNELGQGLFAHTSPIYVEIAGKRLFDVEAARAMLQEIETSEAAIRTQGKFTTPAASAQILTLYEEAAKDLRGRINQRGK